MSPAPQGSWQTWSLRDSKGVISEVFLGKMWWNFVKNVVKNDLRGSQSRNYRLFLSQNVVKAANFCPTGMAATSGIWSRPHGNLWSWGLWRWFGPLAHGNFAVPAKFMGCKPVGQTILVKITPWKIGWTPQLLGCCRREHPAPSQHHHLVQVAICTSRTGGWRMVPPVVVTEPTGVQHPYAPPGCYISPHHCFWGRAMTWVLHVTDYSRHLRQDHNVDIILTSSPCLLVLSREFLGMIHSNYQ